MKLIELINITKKDIPLHYRNEYAGQAVFEASNSERKESKIEFVLERCATGQVDININLLDELNYPLIPIIKSLKSHIFNLEKNGDLP